MGIEIERKFLVRDGRWKSLAEGVLLRQGYLSSSPDRIVRVRVEGDQGLLTIKSRNAGAARGEWEYPIPLFDALTFLEELCERPIIEKLRYRIELCGLVWEVDEFLGENAGLVVAEVELHAPDQRLECPDWVGEEVTEDARYFNANLQRHPYCKW
jgi:adenylate cyclase